MRAGKTGLPIRGTVPSTQKLLVAVGLFLIAFCTASVARGQQKKEERNSNSSDLSSLNMSRVAASSAEIKSILLKEPGLMVELKRWVARDSTEHGQIVGDSELGDDAIFDRLESDIEFRSVATLLVQRYGYLLPKINPESDLAKR